MKKAKIAVVGYGFVGKGVAAGFSKADVTIIDPNLGTSTNDLIESGDKYEAVFICVPTPMREDGTINASIVQTVVEELKSLDTVLVLKSTVVPDIVEELGKKYANFVYNPEFLTEKNAVHDFANPFMNVFGGDLDPCLHLKEVYDNLSVCAPCPVLFMSPKEASFVKYTINSYLAQKVAFFNEMATLIESHGASYEAVRYAVTKDHRVGESHTSVPGHDGRKGFGGSCFIKDVNAMLHFSQGQLDILKAAWNSNVDVRSQYTDLLDREKDQHVSLKKFA